MWPKAKNDAEYNSEKRNHFHFIQGLCTHLYLRTVSQQSPIVRTTETGVIVRVRTAGTRLEGDLATPPFTDEMEQETVYIVPSTRSLLLLGFSTSTTCSFFHIAEREGEVVGCTSLAFTSAEEATDCETAAAAAAAAAADWAAGASEAP
jgi:hypothetical protein